MDRLPGAIDPGVLHDPKSAFPSNGSETGAVGGPMRLGRGSLLMATVAGLACVVPTPVRAADPRHTSPIQITDDGATVWVANPDSDSVGKIATATNTLTGEYPVGDNPRTVALGGGSV